MAWWGGQSRRRRGRSSRVLTHWNRTGGRGGLGNKGRCRQPQPEQAHPRGRRRPSAGSPAGPGGSSCVVSPSTCTGVTHTTPGRGPCDTQTRGCYKVHPSRDQTSPEPPSPCLRSGLRGVRAQDLVSNVLDRHLRCPLLWARSERRGCPRGRPLAAPGTRDAGAPAAPACSLQPPPLPLCLPAGGCQGARHGSRLACRLIYAPQGRRAGSRGAEGKPGAGVGGAGWSRHPRRRREGPRL